MSKAGAKLLATFLIITGLSVAAALPLRLVAAQVDNQYLAGVEPATQVEYAAFERSPSTNYEGLQYAHEILVRYVSGSKVEFKQSYDYGNGTSGKLASSYLTDVSDGTERKFFDSLSFPSSSTKQFFFARDLNRGQPLLHPTYAKHRFLSGLLVGETMHASYAGAMREVNFASIDDRQRGLQVSVYWERSTGLLLEYWVHAKEYEIAYKVVAIDVPSPNATLMPSAVSPPSENLGYTPYVRVIYVGTRDISQPILVEKPVEGATAKLMLPGAPEGYRYGFTSLFGASAPSGITADFHGFEKLVIGVTDDTNSDYDALVARSTHKTRDGRPIFYISNGVASPEVVLTHVDGGVSGRADSPPTMVMVYASAVFYKQLTLQLLEDSLSLPVSSPPAADFDSWGIYVVMGPDSPLRISSVTPPSGGALDPTGVIVLPKTVVFRDSLREFGAYRIAFAKGAGVPISGIVRVEESLGLESPSAYVGWTHYFTARDGQAAREYYIADTTTVGDDNLLIDASEGYFGGAESGYVFFGFPDILLLRSGTRERMHLAMLSVHPLKVTSFEAPGTMYLDVYFDAKVPLSWIGQREIVEAESYFVQVAGRNSGIYYGTYRAQVVWSDLELVVYEADGEPARNVQARLLTLSGEQQVDATTDATGRVTLRPQHPGPFVLQLTKETRLLLAQFLDSSAIAGHEKLTFHLPAGTALPSATTPSEAAAELSSTGENGVSMTVVGMIGSVAVLAGVVMSSLVIRERERSLKRAKAEPGLPATRPWSAYYFTALVMRPLIMNRLKKIMSSTGGSIVTRPAAIRMPFGLTGFAPMEAIITGIVWDAAEPVRMKAKKNST